MNKLRLLFVGFLILLSAIVIKLFFIQVLTNNKSLYNETLQSERIVPIRGAIYDRNREPLALNRITYRLFAEPDKVSHKSEAIERIDKILKLGEATLAAKLGTQKKWISLQTGLTESKKKAIAKMAFPGLGFEEEQRRYYPEGSVAAHLLGFVGKNERGDDVGYFGVEGHYDKDLTGLPGIIKSERDLWGNPIFIGVQDKLKGEDGRDLVLTIDRTVQTLAKNKLKEGIKRYGAEGGCIIIANPQNLEILALVCLPDYGPEKYAEFSEEFFQNPAISVLHEPGSIFKPFTVASALQEGDIGPNDIFEESGPLQIGGYQIRTWDNKYEGTINVIRALEKSSNVVMVEIGQKLGKEKLLKYLNKFGFDEKSGIDLQGESASILKSGSQWYPIDLATVTFGQGIAVNRLQIVKAFAALINGGELYEPYIVKEIISSDRLKVRKRKPRKIRRVLDEKTSGTIRLMLEKTVKYGEVKWDVPADYRIGGKTGTAQIPIEGHYDPTKTVASFIGFAPVDKPQLLILVSLDKPTTSPWGSETAAPLFFELIDKLIVYYNIPPD